MYVHGPFFGWESQMFDLHRKEQQTILVPLLGVLKNQTLSPSELILFLQYFASNERDQTGKSLILGDRKNEGLGFEWQ